MASPPHLVDDELTHSGSGDSSAVTTQPELSDDFTFPVLGLDGSTSNLRSRHTTPPAALSSLGARMAHHSVSSSTSSLDDAYDMIDDISDLSSDDRETASIASTNNHDDDEEESEYDMDAQAGDPIAVDEGSQLPHSSEPELVSGSQTPPLSQDQAFKVRLPFHNGLALSSISNEHMLDSAVDELETPKQSIMTPKAVSPPTSGVDKSHQATAQPAPSQVDIRTQEHKQDAKKTTFPWPYKSKIGPVVASATFLVGNVVAVLLISTLFWASLTSYLPTYEQSHSSVHRIPELDSALQQFTGSDAFAKHINYTHLVPDITMVGTNIFGLAVYGTKDIRYQAVAPNHLVISLPQVHIDSFPTPYTISVKREQDDIMANRTQLIPGVHIVTVDPSNAYGILSVSMACKKPEVALSIAHDFGNRLLHLNTYEKACTDISKAFAKDVAVARDAAKAVSHNLQDDFEASLRLASSKLQSKTRELAILADKAAKSLRDAEQIGKHLADDIGSDLAKASKEIKASFGDALKNVKSLIPTTKVVKEPILLSRERALAIKEKMFGLSKLSFNRRSKRAETKRAKAAKRDAFLERRRAKALSKSDDETTCKDSL